MRSNLKLLIIFGVFLICTSINQDIEESSSQASSQALITNLTLVPISFGNITKDTKFNFTSEEKIERNDLNQISGENFLLNVPENYSNFQSEVYLTVENASINLPLLYNSPAETEVDNTFDYAQAFSVDMNCRLKSFSIKVDDKGKEPTIFNFEIRDGFPNGTTIYSKNLLIENSNWINIHLDSYLKLQPGKYYIYIESQPARKYKSLMGSIEGFNNTETMVYNGTDWLTTNFDIAMKVNISQYFNPEDINLLIGNKTVNNFGDYGGNFSIEDKINSSEYILQYYSTIAENLTINYQSENIFRRFTQIPYEISIEGNLFLWNLSLSLEDYPAPFTNYQVLISKIQTDYTNFKLFTDNQTFEHELLSNGKIKTLYTPQDLSFNSPNHLLSIDSPSSVKMNETTSFNVETETKGNITFYIFSDNGQIYNITHENVKNQVINWFYDPLYASDNIWIEIIFQGDNEIGYSSIPLNSISKAKIITTNYIVKTLEELEIFCQFKDFFNNDTLKEANIIVKLGDYSKEMELNSDNFYISSLDLSKLNIQAGNYTLKILFSKNGYLQEEYQIPIEVQKREMDISVIKKSTTIRSGENFEFKIYISDKERNNNLERPVKIMTKFYASNKNDSSNLIHYSYDEDINNEIDKNWTVPRNLAKIDCALEITVESEFYQGKLFLDEFIQIKKPIPWWILIFPAILAVGSVSGGIIYYREKTKQSLLGLICLHDNGMPLAEKVGKLFTQDILLVSAAFIGILSLIKEMTGSNTREIAIEGGYMSLTKKDGYWMIIFLKKNPKWIKTPILNFIQDFEKKYITKEILEKGMPIDVNLDDLTQKYFHKILKNNKNETDSDSFQAHRISLPHDGQ